MSQSCRLLSRWALHRGRLGLAGNPVKRTPRSRCSRTFPCRSFGKARGCNSARGVQRAQPPAVQRAERPGQRRQLRRDQQHGQFAARGAAGLEVVFLNCGAMRASPLQDVTKGPGVSSGPFSFRRFAYGKNLVCTHAIECLVNPAGPPDFQLVQALGRAQAEMHARVARCAQTGAGGGVIV